MSVSTLKWKQKLLLEIRERHLVEAHAKHIWSKYSFISTGYVSNRTVSIGTHYCHKIPSTQALPKPNRGGVEYTR